MLLSFKKVSTYYNFLCYNFESAKIHFFLINQIFESFFFFLNFECPYNSNCYLCRLNFKFNTFMEKVVKPNKSYLQFGVFYGVIMILLAVIIYTMNIDLVQDRLIGTSNSILGYVFLPFLCVYLGCVNFKKNNFGYISFVECLKVGVGIIFVGAIIFALFNILFYYMFPDNLENIVSQTKQMMLKDDPQLTVAQLEMTASMMRKFSAPVFAFPLTLAMLTFLGFLYSLFVGLIVKKDNPAGI